MKGMFRVAIVLPVLLFVGTTAGIAAEPALPVIGGKEVVATVNGEPITGEELNQAVSTHHAEMEGTRKAGGIDFTDVVNRLINLRLILLEARNIGLDQLPEIREAVDAYSREALMQVLLKEQTKGVEAEAAEVEGVYRHLVREYRIRSLLFGEEENARKAEAKIRAGRGFDEIAGEAVAEGTAKEVGAGAGVKPDQLLPEIQQAISGKEAGSVSSVIKLQQGYVILKLEEVRYPELPSAREQAKEIVRNNRKAETALRYVRDLREKYVDVKQDVLDSLDFESETPGFEALRKDRRVVAEIRGEDPVTVGDLTESLGKTFFHGAERAAQKKRLNASKGKVFETVVNKRVIRSEALRRGMDKTEAYTGMVKEYENSVLFGAFLTKVIRPGIRVEEKEVRDYYDEHIGEFSSPEMMRIDSIAFSRKDRAEEAFRRVREGTDFFWLGANAEGRVEENAEGLLRFRGNLIAVNALPTALQKTVSRARSGEYRLYESPEGHHYLLFLREVLPPKPEPYEEARARIAPIVVGEKTKREVDVYADKLREFYPVKILLKGPKSQTYHRSRRERT